MKFYVTKYALSGVVSHEEGELWGDHGKYFRPDGHKHRMLVVGLDCFLNRGDAVARIAEMKTKKIASHARRLVSIQRIDPEHVVPEETA